MEGRYIALSVDYEKYEVNILNINVYTERVINGKKSSYRIDIYCLAYRIFFYNFVKFCMDIASLSIYKTNE
jgi:hypothetical protein